MSKALTRVTQVKFNFSFFFKPSLTPFLKCIGDKEPMLYVDVNLGNSGTQRIVVYEGETAEGLAEKFAKEWNLDLQMQERLTQMLQ